jgi:hypothetical protein
MDELEKRSRENVILKIKDVKHAEKMLEKAKEALKTAEVILVELLEAKRIQQFNKDVEAASHSPVRQLENWKRVLKRINHPSTIKLSNILDYLDSNLFPCPHIELPDSVCLSLFFKTRQRD